MYGAVEAGHHAAASGGEGQGAALGRARRVVGITVTAVVALVATALIVTQAREPSELLAYGEQVQPGTQLELQTSRGPMQITVDSPMSPEGYVHATGFEGGVEYQGWVRLSQDSGAPQQQLQYGGAQPQLQYGEVAQQQQLAEVPAVPQQAAFQGGGRETLDISRSGAVTINGEPVVAANSRTAAILRLLAKQASGARTQSLAQYGGGAADFAREISRGSRLVGRLRGGGGGRGGGAGEDKALWGAMQSLMQNVNKMERRQETMAKTVNKVKKIMRYTP